jgi:hypothetical protein
MYVWGKNEYGALERGFAQPRVWYETVNLDMIQMFFGVRAGFYSHGMSTQANGHWFQWGSAPMF